MADSKIIEIMLVDGNPVGIRVVTIANWAGIALATYRSDLPRFLDREELERPAVYFLAGKDCATGKTAIYVGESDSFKQRIKGHIDKTFWDQVIVFTSNDGRFNKATVKYLEASFYDDMVNAGNIVVMNGNRPRGVSLGESDTSIANEYKQNACIVLGVLGFIDVDVHHSSPLRDVETPVKPVVISPAPLPMQRLFEEKVSKSGWIMGSTTRGYVRFLTPRLKELIPCNSTGNWKGRESFLFEIDFHQSNINFRTVISPGDESTRDILTESIHSVSGALEPRGEQWLVHFNRKLVELPRPKGRGLPGGHDKMTGENISDGDMKAKIDKNWPEVKDIVRKVEDAIIKKRRDLESCHRVSPGRG
jgi:hypothetical protein